MISVKDIVRKYLEDNGFDGLENQEAECGCDGSAPCSEGPHSNCNAAILSTNDDGEPAYFSVPQTIEEVDIDSKNHCRNLRGEEVEFFRKHGRKG